MKKVILAVLVAVVLSSLSLASCIGGTVTGSGNLKTETFNFTDFTKVEAESGFQVELTKSSTFSVEITADNNVLEYIEVDKSGDTLRIRPKRNRIYRSATLRANITMPDLRSLDLSGATRGTVSGFSSTENLDIDVSGASSVELTDVSTGDVKFDISGASKVTGDITAGDADFDISGASTLQLEGSAKDIIVEAGGASRVKLSGFTVNNANINLSGASSGTVNLDGRLDADLSGASKLSYIGEPTMGTINTSGASTLSKK